MRDDSNHSATGHSATTPATSRSPLAAALLNLSGLSAGYLYLRRWRRGLFHLAVTGGLLAVAANRDAAGRPALWITLLGLWVAWMVWDGWRQGRRLFPHRTAARQGRPTGPTIVAGLLAVVVVVAFTQYRAAGDRAFAAAVDSHRAADCQDARGRYERVTTFYELTLSPVVASADANSRECAAFLHAAEVLQRGDFAAAVDGHHDYQRQHPDGLLAEPIQIQLGETYDEWALSLREAGEYRDAIEVYNQRLGDLPDEPVTGGVSAVYDQWALSLRGSNQHREAVDVYAELLDAYPDAPLAAQVPQAVINTYNEAVQPLKEGRPCDVIDVLDAFSSLPAAVAEPVATQARGAVPQTLYDCGAVLNDRGRYDEAISTLERALETAAGTPLAGRAEALLITAQVGQIKDANPGELPPPQAVGSAPGGSVVVEILNDSPEELEVLTSGPRATRTIVPPCGDCTTYFVAPPFCNEGASRPRVTLELDPGSYDVVVRARSDSSVTPWAGDWDMSGGTRYFNCFYIERGFG